MMEPVRQEDVFLTTVTKSKAAVYLLLAALMGLIAGSTCTAQDDADDALIQMIVDLVNDKERDMRALGFQQIRDETPGEAATKQFAALLPKLPPDGQAGLLEALGDRGDATALPTALEMLGSAEEIVRAASLKALGSLGGAAEVPVLTEKAAQGSTAEQAAARQSLVRLRGEEVNAAIVAAMAAGEPDVRVELLGVLAARNARSALPAVLESASAPEPSVQLAALEALRFLADEDQIAVLVGILKAAQGDAQRKKAELAMLAVCSRAREACAEAIIAGLDDADGASRIVLLRGLARSGGAKALETLVARLKDEDESVRDEAVRMLSVWPDPAAAPHLQVLAKSDGSPRHQVLAIRGLVRMASQQPEKPADVAKLIEAMQRAKRPQEKRLVLGALGTTSAAEALATVTAAMDVPGLAEEAGLAATMIAEKTGDGDKDLARTAMEKVITSVKSKQTLDRAKKVLEAL